MQSLLPRAAEAHICSSRASLHIFSSIRRATISRHQCEQSDVFIAPYTTGFGSDAMLEAFHNDGNPQNLDGRTGGTRKGPTISRYYADFRQMRPRVPMGAIEALNSICDTEEALERHQSSGRNLRRFLRSLHRCYDPKGEVGSHHGEYLGSNLTALQLAVDQEQRQDDGLQAREPMTNKQFERFHSMINKMVDHLITESYYAEFPRDPERARRNLESLDSAWTAIRLLRSEGYPKYNHPSVDPQATKQARDQLADKIRALLEAWGRDSAAKPKFQVAKICYNLLVCPVPPSMHHYNLLLVGFLRKSHFSLGDIVADSFLEDSRFRPTPLTHVCLLSHYRSKRDIKGFYHIIRRMMVLDNRGILLRRRWYEDVAKVPVLRQWARHPEVTTSLQSNWVVERPSRGQEIYEALVSGLLGFGRVKDAVKVFTGSLQERMGVSVELFTYMLKQCLYTLDASAAAILARGLIDNADVLIPLLLRDDCPQRLIEHLYPVLNLGEPQSWPVSEDRAQMIWNLGTMATDPQDQSKIGRIRRAMFIRYTETYLTRLGKRTKPIHLIFRAKSPTERFVIAQHCTTALFWHPERQRKLSATILKHQTLQKTVRMLEAITWDLGSPENLAKRHSRVVRVLGDNMPRPVGADTYEKTAHFEGITTIADDWFHYRISKMRGVLSDTRRLMLHAQLRMITGRRMMLDALQLLRAPVDFGWRSLDISKPETKAEADREQQGQGQAGHQEAPAEEGGLWPGAETRAFLAPVAR